MQLGKISSADLQLYLNFYPQLSEELEEAREILLGRPDVFFAEDCHKPAWCHFYEKPINEHVVTVLVGLGAEAMFKDIASAPNQIQAMPVVTDAFLRALDDEELTMEEADELRKVLAVILGLSVSVVNTFRSLLIFGFYLNYLVEQVRTSGKAADKALFQAVKIDPSVLGCQSFSERISRAVIENDKAFLRKLQRAIEGKLTKREDATYQRQRVVLQILYETGAPQLSEEDLYQLFVEELNLVARERDSDVGNVANNLRQFAYQFMKQKSVSQNN